METWSKELDLKQLGEQFGTPIYVFNPQQLEQNFLDYLHIVQQPANIAYPVKANPSFEVLRTLYHLGSSAECASMSEINLAQAAGFPPKRIIFNSPTANSADVLDLLRRGFTVIIDSAELLKDLDARYDGSMPVRLLVRINPHIPVEYASSEDWQSVTAHGSSTAKFGIASESLVSLLQAVKIPVCGLHVHVGTQMDNTQSFVTITHFLHSLLDQIHAETTHQIHILDLGGGLGIDFVNRDRYPKISDLTTAIAPLFRPEITYLMEPGQSLVGNTMGVLTKVVASKEIRGKRWAIADVGSDQLIKITLLNWHHQILKADHQPLDTAGPDAVGGPLCFSGDVLLPTTDLTGVRTGDYLFIQHCGAYCYAVSNRFNGRTYAGMIKLTPNNEWVVCNSPESEFLSSVYATYRWQQDSVTWPMPKMIDLETANRLNSDYLQHQSAHDHYDIVAMQKLSENQFEFEFQVSSEVSFVSMPFGLRLIADATIASVLHAVGKEHKDISVWGDELILHCAQQIRSNRTLNCRISLSPMVAEERRRIGLAEFSLDHGKFSGYVRPVFKV